MARAFAIRVPVIYEGGWQGCCLGIGHAEYDYQEEG